MEDQNIKLPLLEKCSNFQYVSDSVIVSTTMNERHRHPGRVYSVVVNIDK